ncbi:DNA recombination protein RmuC [Occallatibacter riparius]|uniref:DNA recombination protein RmuC n=1 Tax=Occallatibacter riparius TaxID=1002689 RepID=A0A9J7BU85_9BACT|nr:DNA recombination protein RmuC [Occallatibacter riparius]UWZ86444.1 DNA recombination protein RmuC [Occallatibacter riparius]
MQALIPVLAALIGIVAGYLLRQFAAKSERAAIESEKAQLAQRAAELSSELTLARADLAQSRTLAERRAGFESLSAERQSTIDRLTADLITARDALHTQSTAASDSASKSSARIGELETALLNERAKVQERDEFIKNARIELANHFEALAGKLFDERSKSFSESSQKDLNTLLAPLQTQIKEFREKVEKVQTESTVGVTELKTLVANLNTMNQQLSDEAHNLTTALRGSAKAQGDWGEFILRDLLDKAGLRENEQYTFQQSHTAEAESGQRARSVRTDVVLHLPGGRHLVIDSKVSLNAYTDCINATDEDARKAALKLHLTSVRNHVAGLARAGYHRLPEIEAPDFVVMFVPVEPAFLMALQSDAELWADAYKQGILLVGPTTLLYVIRIINVLWQQERQARNVKDVMDRGTELYEKFVGFVTDMEVLGDSIRKSDQHYTNAMKKLADGRGNLIRQVELLKKLGLRTTKSIPQKLLDRAEVDQAELALTPDSDADATTAE